MRYPVTKKTRIKNVLVRINEGILSCEIEIENVNDLRAQFAFYIFRNDERVHVHWYSDSPFFELDTNRSPGYYRVEGFVKFDDNHLENRKSSYVFADPIKVSSAEALVDGNSRAYLIRGKYWDYPCIYYPKVSDSLFVMMPSAIDRSKISLPSFSRWTWAKDLPGSVLCLADPTLELDKALRLGWLIGDKTRCATKDIAEFIMDLAQKKGIPREKIVIYGSSAGGFSALALAAYIEGSVAVAINAQTDALSYNVAEQVDLVRKACFEDMSSDAVRENFPDRVDMVSRWAAVKQSRVILVQNILDDHHYDVHFQPFWKSLGGGDPAEGLFECGRHVAWVYRQEGGHIPETKEMAQKIISMLSDANYNGC